MVRVPKDDVLSPLTLVLGDEELLVARAVSEVGQTARAADADAEVRDLTCGELQRGDLDDALSPSLFGGRRVVVVHDADQLPAEAQRELAAYLADPSPTGLLVLLAGRPVPKLAQAVRGTGRVVDAARGRRGDVLTWLREHARGAGLKPSSDALNALLEAVGEERMALARAVEELTLANGAGARITPEHVRRQFQGRQQRVEGFPTARRLAAPAVHHQVLRALGHLGVEVVLQHAVGGFLQPALAGEVGPARGTDGAGAPERCHHALSFT